MQRCFLNAVTMHTGCVCGCVFVFLPFFPLLLQFISCLIYTDLILGEKKTGNTFEENDGMRKKKLLMRQLGV